MKKRLLILLTIFLILSLCSCAETGKSLDAHAQYVADCVKLLQDQAGEISLENDILYSVSEGGYRYVVIEFKSNDGYDIAYFEEGDFIGTETDKKNLDKISCDYVTTGRLTEEEYMEILDRKISLSEAKLQIARWNVIAASGNEGLEDIHLVNAEKIGKALDIAYTKN